MSAVLARLGHRYLSRMPLQRYLGFDELAALPRWLVAMSLTTGAVLGALESDNGHIETTPFLNLVMPTISGINPALGLFSALMFGLADWAEKLVNIESVWGARSVVDHVGARIGYLIAYLSVVGWGVLPGVLSRVFRGWVSALAAERARRRSVGAAYAISRPSRLVETFAGAAGGALGAGIANIAAIAISAPAFYLRWTPDHTCFAMARGNLTSLDLLHVGSLARAVLAGGVLGPAAASVVPTSSPDRTDEEPEPQPDRPEWSLANRPSSDHRWDPETGRWVLIEDLQARSMQREGYVLDEASGTWIKPPVIDVPPLDQVALQPTSGARVSRQWADLEAAEGDYASIPSRLTAEVDAYNLERRRLDALDRMYREQLDAYRRIDTALDEARAQGHAGLIAHLENRRQLARDNIQQVQRARDDAVGRLSHCGDAIVARGLGATMHLGLKGSTDAIVLIEATNLVGKPLPPGGARRTVSDLSGQREVFRNAGETAETVGEFETQLPRLRPRSGDRLLSQTLSSGNRGLEVEELTGGARGLPVIRPRPGAQFASPAPTAYGGKRVVIDSSMRSLGRCNLADPTKITINPTRIAASAQRYQAPVGEWEILSKHHEVTHLDKVIGRTRFVQETAAGAPTLTPLSTPSSGLAGVPHQRQRLLLQHVSNNVITEQRVQFHMRQDFAAGRIRGVSPDTFAKWETFNQDRLASLQRLRVKLLQRLNLSYRP